MDCQTSVLYCIFYCADITTGINVRTILFYQLFRGAIEYNSQRDKARIWSAIEHFLQLANTGYENIKLSVKSERHTKFVDMYFFNETELSEKQNFAKQEGDEFITIDLCDTTERSSHYYTTYDKLIDE